MEHLVWDGKDENLMILNLNRDIHSNVYKKIDLLHSVCHASSPSMTDVAYPWDEPHIMQDTYKTNIYIISYNII